MAGMCARSCLEGMCDQLQSGEVNIADLQKVYKNREQMQRLCLAISSSEDGRYSYQSVETAVHKRLEEYKAVKRRKEVLSHLSRHIYSEEVQGMLQCYTGIAWYGSVLDIIAIKFNFGLPYPVKETGIEAMGYR